MKLKKIIISSRISHLKILFSLWVKIFLKNDLMNFSIRRRSVCSRTLSSPLPPLFSNHLHGDGDAGVLVGLALQRLHRARGGGQTEPDPQPLQHQRVYGEEFIQLIN